MHYPWDVNPFLVWLARAKVAKYSPRHAKAGRCVDRRHESGNARARRRFLAAGAISNRKNGGTAQHSMRSVAHMKPLAASAVSKPAKESGQARVLPNPNHGRRTSVSGTSRCRSPSQARRPSKPRCGSRRHCWQRMRRLPAQAALGLPSAERRALLGDARCVADFSGDSRFGTVITSPPYVNRMSYVRELRPYMYWLGYLTDARDAGELDWQAIGGTWGAATSRVAVWQANAELPLSGLAALVKRIARQSDVLSRYVQKYFFDMLGHVQSNVARGRAWRPGALRGGQLEVLRRGRAGRAAIFRNVRELGVSRRDGGEAEEALEQARAVRVLGQRDQALNQRSWLVPDSSRSPARKRTPADDSFQSDSPAMGFNSTRTSRSIRVMRHFDWIESTDSNPAAISTRLSRLIPALRPFRLDLSRLSTAGSPHFDSIESARSGEAALFDSIESTDSSTAAHSDSTATLDPSVAVVAVAAVRARRRVACLVPARVAPARVAAAFATRVESRPARALCRRPPTPKAFAATCDAP